MLLVKDIIAQEDMLPPPEKEHHDACMLKYSTLRSRGSFLYTPCCIPSIRFNFVGTLCVQTGQPIQTIIYSNNK